MGVHPAKLMATICSDDNDDDDDNDDKDDIRGRIKFCDRPQKHDNPPSPAQPKEVCFGKYCIILG